MIVDTTILPLILFWPVLIAAIVIYLLRKRERGVGLVVYYLLLFTIQQWSAAAVQLVPGYIPSQDPNLTQLGTTYSFVGLVSFLVGALVIAPSLWKSHESPQTLRVSQQSTEYQRSPSAPIFLFAFGAFSYFVLTPTIGNL